MAKKTPTKQDRIRKLLQENPKITGPEVQAKLKGIKVYSSEVTAARKKYAREMAGPDDDDAVARLRTASANSNDAAGNLSEQQQRLLALAEATNQYPDWDSVDNDLALLKQLYS